MLAEILARYLEVYPEERQKLKLLQGQLKNGDKLNDRRNFSGHITASGVILSRDKRRILLIHHKAYDQWQQPGGHWEKIDADLLQAAKRESTEETGLELSRYITLDPKQPLVPFDIDTHAVPARPDKDEPPHYHHDFRYVFLSDKVKIKHQPAEVKAAQWVSFEAPETKRVQPIIEKLRTAQIIT
jgi:8-oxo-dGTP pyrophosphatase MutT (NUDIX family)